MVKFPFVYPSNATVFPISNHLFNVDPFFEITYTETTHKHLMSLLIMSLLPFIC